MDRHRTRMLLRKLKEYQLNLSGTRIILTQAAYSWSALLCLDSP